MDVEQKLGRSAETRLWRGGFRGFEAHSSMGLQHFPHIHGVSLLESEALTGLGTRRSRLTAGSGGGSAAAEHTASLKPLLSRTKCCQLATFPPTKPRPANSPASGFHELRGPLRENSCCVAELPELAEDGHGNLGPQCLLEKIATMEELFVQQLGEGAGLEFRGTHLLRIQQKGPSIGFWDLESGQETAKLPTLCSVPHGVVVSPDGEYAFVTVKGKGGEPGTVEVCHLPTQRAHSVEMGNQAGGSFSGKSAQHPEQG